MPSAITFQSLTGSSEFKEVLSGKKINSNLFTIFYKNKNSSDENGSIQLSCVAAKKLGNAVKRNRMRRRLKMATRKAILEIETNFKKKFKYAVFAKSKIYDVKFQEIVDELIIKLKSI
jgi:ribonuclease P protein component